MYWFIPIDSEVKVIQGNFNKKKLIDLHQKIYKNVDHKNIFKINNFLNSEKLVKNNFLKKFDLDILTLKENLEKISNSLEIFNQNDYTEKKFFDFKKEEKNIIFDIKAYCNEEDYCECDSISNELLNEDTNNIFIYYNQVFMSGYISEDKINSEMFPELKLVESVKLVDSDILLFKEKINEELYHNDKSLQNKINSLKTNGYTPINYTDIKKLFFRKFDVEKSNKRPLMFYNIYKEILSSINKEEITENLKEYYKRTLLKIIDELELEKIKLDNNFGYLGLVLKENEKSKLKSDLEKYENQISKIPVVYFNEKLIDLEEKRKLHI